MKTKLIVLVMLAGAFGMACNNSETPLKGGRAVETEVPKEPEPEATVTLKPREDIVLTRAEEAVVAGNNVFAFNLLRQVAGEAPDENLLLSPLSLSLALGMLNNGAGGQTQEEIQTALGYGDVTRDEVNGYFRKITDALQELDTYVRFESANSIWIAEELPVLEAFKEVNRTYFDADVLDFDLYDPASTVKRINGWCSEKTQGLIPKLLDDLDQEVVMYLLNALYFKGSWTLPFDKSLTEETPFSNLNGSTANRPTMKQIAPLKYAKTETFEIVELPYGNAAFDMTLLLPATGVSVASILETLDAAAWDDALLKLVQTSIDIRLPRFKVEYGRTLNGDLKTLGMTSMFGAEADFSLIADSLYVSKVLQKTSLEVNEEGAEGAAATVIEMKDIMPLEPIQPYVLEFNRPFAYFIKEKSTGSIVFAGIIQNL
ncbi:MAG: serpin family protein [Tannerella sp.]|jgi:serpin B|nr:serpin family protein [Tannerella sp.]